MTDSWFLVAAPSNDVLINLSDGLHCTYMQVSPTDAEALLTVVRPHLVAHLIHLDRLRLVWPMPHALGLCLVRPMPHALGLRTVPSSRSLPCVGVPQPLVVRPVYIINKRGISRVGYLIY